MPATWTDPTTGRMFYTGPVDANGIATFLSPRHKLAGMIPHIPLNAPPVQVIRNSAYRSNFGNSRFGDCVSAEEAATKSFYGYQIQEQTVIDWARQHGELNGADLQTVCDEMAQKGFMEGAQLYNDGPASSVDWTNETVLQSAIAQGPVKIAIAAGALPSGAGSHDGWYGASTNNRRTDHCVCLPGYGPAGAICQELKVAVPSGLSPDTLVYECYTWSTIGIVTFRWIGGTCDEALLRNPTTLGVPPLTPPVPPTPPGPSPLPTIQGVLTVSNGMVTLPTNLIDGTYVIFPKTII